MYGAITYLTQGTDYPNFHPWQANCLLQFLIWSGQYRHTASKYTGKRWRRTEVSERQAKASTNHPLHTTSHSASHHHISITMEPPMSNKTMDDRWNCFDWILWKLANGSSTGLLSNNK